MRVKLESLDNKPITERTGKTSVIAETNRLPVERKIQTFMYENEDCESPGVSIQTNGIEIISNQIKFFDHSRRPFMITILD